MNYKYFAVLLAAMLPGLSLAQNAQNYQCTYGDLQRRVEILYEAGNTVPCEVHYYKDSEAPDERQVLWRALNESGYCESKTREFIARLEGWGWNCGQGTDAVQEPDDPADDSGSGQDDDTDALVPAEETETTEVQ